ncbi:MAG: hypothetical protein IH602_00200, partial [Bryobacteraceae bacterium]|nr:hypothetical protein [Bryobacteraceae bacterium]
PLYGAPPPYGAPQYGAPQYGAQPPYGAQPQGDIAAQISAKSGAVLGALNLQNAQGTGIVLAMMIRAAMLDGSVARAAAADVNGNGKAFTAILISMSVPTLVAIIFGSSYMTTAAGLTITLATLAISVALTFVAIGLMSACSQAIVGRKLSFGEIFRGLAYAQSPALLTFIPVVGMLAGLWRLPTTLVALRDMTPTTMGKAFGLLLVGALASVVLSMMLMPIIIGMLGTSFSRF